jgi:N6-L-threonylcarbamoyladenine synthase
MNILSIETSCDDTCVAIVNSDKKVLSNVISSQNDVHAEYGGINPSLAKREHENNILPVFEKALKNAGFLIENDEKFEIKKETEEILERYPALLKELEVFLTKYKKPNIDKIAITVGPGLEPCLWVGINFAKALALNWDIELIPVNHIESHILANFIDIKNKDIFPSLCLVISGGNTKLFLMEEIGKYQELGSTRDDAAGECFDKTARLLGLPYPGGPEISKRSTIGRSDIKLPRPMINSQDYDFSFSGLKTAVYYETKDKELNEEYVDQLCYEIQESIIDVIEKKLKKAIIEFNPQSIMLGGGVSTNQELQKRIKKLADRYGIKLFIPHGYTMDNAVMGGIAALLVSNKYDRIEANSNLYLNE